MLNLSVGARPPLMGSLQAFLGLGDLGCPRIRFPDEMVPHWLNIEFNRAQRLVHDDVAMMKFRSFYDIPNDVLIERPSPNEVATSRGLHPGFGKFCSHRACSGHINVKERATVQCLRFVLHMYNVEEEGEEVEQVVGVAILVNLPVMYPVLIILDEEGPADPKFSSVPPAIKDEVDHSFVRGKGVDSNSKVDIPLKAKNLDNAFAPQKSKVVLAHIVQDPIPIQVPALVPGLAVMPPQDVTDLVVGDSVEAGNLWQDGQSTTRSGRVSKVAKLPPNIFHACWIAYLKELSTPSEEYANQPTEKEAEDEGEVGDQDAREEGKLGVKAKGYGDGGVSGRAL
ncbi:hypothetical protein Acr_11g0008050 [Actinidia rufa]|uniref:Uncharacterized protein n=1 Tax=Actinidia rufa TaxID=165716 RepID=A0A7J0FEA4_9ERIC|nr:hypothetical protein Acr_11g0008050 [Actinidia rufa]